MKKELTALIVLALAVGMAAVGTAQTADDSETGDVNVNVSSTTTLDVKPDEINYTDISVGSRVNNSDRNFTAIQIENSGSTDIKEIWAANSMPTSDPYGTGTASNYVASNFFQLKAKRSSQPFRGDDKNYHFINRVEYFQENNTIVTTDDDGSWSGTAYSNFKVGRIRTGNEYTYFAIGYDTQCDGTSSDQADIRIGDTSSTPSSLGTYDFSDDASDWTKYDITDASNSNYGITNSTVKLDHLNGETQKYDILTDCSGNADEDLSTSAGHVILTKYNVDAAGASDLAATGGDGNAANHLFRAASSSSDLDPGQIFSIYAAVQVSNGIPTGSDLSQGTVTIYSQTR